MKDVSNQYLKAFVYLIGFFFLGAIIIAISQAILSVFDKYVFGHEVWKWWISCSILGGVIYWLFISISNKDNS